MKRTDLTILQRFWLETLWLGARVFAVMPYWFKYYVVENLLFVLLAFLLGYGVLYLGDQADSDMQTAIYREII